MQYSADNYVRKSSYTGYKNSSVEDVLKLRRITPRRQQFDIIPTQVVDSALTVNNNEDD